MQTELTQALTAIESLAEAIKKLQTQPDPQPSMPYPFEVGKVYKTTYGQYSWIFKFKSCEVNGFKINYDWCVNLTINHFVENDYITLHGKTFSPADPSEYSQYLPDGHADKIPQLSIKGAWYEVVSVDENDSGKGVKVGDKVQAIEDNDDTPYCTLNGKEYTPSGNPYVFDMKQLRHLPNYVPPVEYITEVSKLPVVSESDCNKASAYIQILRIVAYCNSQFKADGREWTFTKSLNLESWSLKSTCSAERGYHFTSRKAIELCQSTPDFIKQFEVWMN